MLINFLKNFLEPNGRQTARILVLCGLLVLLLIPQAASAAASSVQKQSKSITYNGKSYSVNWITIDLKDPTLRVKPVTASAGIGHVESFTWMMQKSNAVAGINGAFFDAYETDESVRYPNGLMIKSGEVMHSGENQAFTILPDKTAAVERIKTKLKVTVNHKGSPYAFEPWGVNKYYGSSQADQVIWYTQDFGKSIDFPETTKVVIEGGIITAITQGSAVIPEDGQVCMVGNSTNNTTYLLPNLHVGDKVTTTASSLNSATGAEAALPQIDAAVGAGPLLLKNAVVDIDTTRDGFTDPRITTNANTRSFIGVDSSKRLVMGTMSSATITNMAQVLLKLGLTDAMNLDGGASSALYANGSVITSPGRLLSNVLVIERLPQAQIQIAVNGQFVNEFRGYMQSETTMVPFRGILERVGADFKWDDQARALTVKHGKQQLFLRPDDKVIQVNGKPVTLTVAPTIKDGHIYLPLRAVIESLGGQLSWDADLYRASLTFDKTTNN
jgi:exopolysaccharide biosynthesis protein